MFLLVVCCNFWKEQISTWQGFASVLASSALRSEKKCDAKQWECIQVHLDFTNLTQELMLWIAFNPGSKVSNSLSWPYKTFTLFASSLTKAPNPACKCALSISALTAFSSIASSSYIQDSSFPAGPCWRLLMRALREVLFPEHRFLKVLWTELISCIVFHLDVAASSDCWKELLMLLLCNCL